MKAHDKSVRLKNNPDLSKPLVLVYEKTGKPVHVGDKVISFRGDKYTVTGFELPHHSGSTGRVNVKNRHGETQYFPGVFDMEWRVKARSVNPGKRVRKLPSLTFGIFAHKRGGKRMHYDGDRFTESGKPHSFRNSENAAKVGRELIERYPILKKYIVEVAPIATAAGERAAKDDLRKVKRKLGKL